VVEDKTISEVMNLNGYWPGWRGYQDVPRPYKVLKDTQKKPWIDGPLDFINDKKTSY